MFVGSLLPVAAAWGTKNNAASLDLRSSFVATRQSANKFAIAPLPPERHPSDRASIVKSNFLFFMLNLF